MSLRSLSQSAGESEQLEQASALHSGPGMKRGSQTWPLVTLGGVTKRPQGAVGNAISHTYGHSVSRQAFLLTQVGQGSVGEMDDMRALPGPHHPGS